MARTITEITDSIIQAKNNNPTLAGLNSPSQTARWKMWVDVVAYAIWVMEKLWDVFREQIIDTLDSNPYIGTLPWYAKQSLLFQYSSTNSYYITFDENNRPTYNIINPNDQIVKYSAATEGAFASVVIKVAKDVGGEPSPLDATELQMFADFMETIKIAGTRLTCISLPADPLKIYADIYFDPIANPSLVQAMVLNAVNNYLISLPFNGILYVEKIQDAIQQVPNVVSVQIQNISVNYGSGDITINRVLQTLSGYARLDSSSPLISTLNFIASNV